MGSRPIFGRKTNNETIKEKSHRAMYRALDVAGKNRQKKIGLAWMEEVQKQHRLSVLVL